MGGDAPAAPITAVLLKQVGSSTQGCEKATQGQKTSLLRYELYFIILRQGLLSTTAVVGG